MSDGTFSKGGSSLKFAIGDSPTVAELQKRADRANQSVLIFFWPVLIFGKSTRKTVLLCP